MPIASAHNRAAFSPGNSTRADDDETPDQTDRQTEVTDVRSLIDRIEALEKRLSELEKRDAPIRQADNRDEQNTTVPRNVWQSREEPVLKIEDDDASQNTNGQKWRFRLLGHRH